MLALGVERGHLAVEDGVISYVGEPLGDTAGKVVVGASGCYVLPGFIELHTHGAAGFDLTSGRHDPRTDTFDKSDAAYEECLAKLTAQMARNGATRVVLGTIAAPEEDLERALGHLGRYVLGERNGLDGAVIHGALIEGTFIKYEEYSGAQNSRYFREPSIELFERLNALAGGTVRTVNVVPEYGAKALELIEHLVVGNVVAAAGHTRAPADLYGKAVDRGLTLALHFTNGPTGSSLKSFSGGGVLQAVLQSHKVFA